MKNKSNVLNQEAKKKKDEFLGWVIAAIILLFILSNFGCAKKHVYLTRDGKQVETSEFGLRAMAIRDQNIEVETSYNEAVSKTKNSTQDMALMANKLVSREQPIERDPSWSEEGRAWAGLFLRYFAGGIDVGNNRQVNSQVYNINGDGNNMSGINNRARSDQGDVSQSLFTAATPYKTEEWWIQRDSGNSANGSGSTEGTRTEAPQL